MMSLSLQHGTIVAHGWRAMLFKELCRIMMVSSVVDVLVEVPTASDANAVACKTMTVVTERTQKGLQRRPS